MSTLSPPPIPHALSSPDQVPKMATPSFHPTGSSPHWDSDQVLPQDLDRSNSNVGISDFQAVSCENSKIGQMYAPVSFPEKQK